MKAVDLIKEFKRHELGPYIEVPCSILGPLIEALTHDKECEVMNPVNEAIAMGLATGSFLATNRVPVVLTQNSGLCNTLNALTSLNQTYKIPVLYLIAWRGLPGAEDAPEHDIMGSKLEGILKAFGIPYEILSEEYYEDQIRSAVNGIFSSKEPGALLLAKGVVEKEKRGTKGRKPGYGLSMADAVNTIISVTGGEACYVATNGYISREARYALSVNGLEEKSPCFYMLGSMGHALPIALGIERYSRAGRKTVVLDGDGGCLMHLGAMASVGRGNRAATNLIHIVLDNGVYASTGGQPTVSGDLDFSKIARGCGYRNVYSAREASSLAQIMNRLLNSRGPSFVHVRIDDSDESPKLRVSEKCTCEDIRQSFMEGLFHY